MLRSLVVVGVVLTLLASVIQAAEVRADHPRMLLNAETLPLIRERCRTVDEAVFDALIGRLEQAMNDPPQPHR